MLTLCRVLAVVTTLFAAVPAKMWGAADRPCVQGAHDTGDHDEPCNDESPDCASCLCCHLRAAPYASNASMVDGGALVERVMTPRTLRTSQPSRSGVFHPPRA